MTVTASVPHPPLSSIRRIFSRSMLFAFALGFSSGFPFAAIESTLQAWLTDSGLSLELIAEFGLVTLPYSLKFLWAPFLDQHIPPFLGRRRGWAVISLFGLILSFGGMAYCSPSENITLLIFCATAAAFFGASQDIALDAQRRELFSNSELGLASTFFTNGYRVGLIASGAGALTMAEFFPWWQVYAVTAGCALLCAVIVSLSPEPLFTRSFASRTFASQAVEPFVEFFARRGWIILLAVVFFFKFGDSMAAALRTVFLLQVGYSKIEIAQISKAVGLAASICGAFAGGVLMLRMTLFKALWIFGIFQAFSTLGFSFIARTSPDNILLAGVIGFENFTGGLGTAAYVAFVSSICDRRFSGTQYAALTSLMRVPSIIASSQAGYFVQIFGWNGFFIGCTALALPAFLFLPRCEAIVESKS